VPNPSSALDYGTVGISLRAQRAKKWGKRRRCFNEIKIQILRWCFLLSKPTWTCWKTLAITKTYNQVFTCFLNWNQLSIITQNRI
jgi:hypothetical protein